MRMNDRTLLAPDGTRIAFGVAGTGPALMLSNGLTTTTTFWKYLRPMWQEEYTVVTWDLPGHGGSGPAATPQSATIEAQPAIMARIMDTLGLQSVVHVGWSVGSQIVLEMYRQYPERVRALVILFGPAGKALESTRLPVSGKLIERTMRHPQAHRLTALLTRICALPMAPGVPELLRKARLIGLQTSEKDLRQVLDDLSRLDPKTVPIMTVSTQRHLAYDVLPSVRVPTLIMAARRDPFMPVDHVAMPMHQAAPGSELVVLETATHAALLDYPDEIAKHVDDFLRRRLS